MWEVVINASEDASYAYNIIIDSPGAIERFVDDIRPLEKAKQVELKRERFKDYALEDIEPENIFRQPNDEDNLDITLVSVILRYSRRSASV